jgi:DNA-binding NtrC family response regulator
MKACPRVLVVDDDELVSEMLSFALSESYQVVCAADIAQALAVLKGLRIDVVLADLRLRGESGLTVNAQAERMKVPLVWMTGDPDALAELGLHSAMVLPKPFDLQHVFDALAKAREPRQIPSQPRSSAAA